MVWALRDNRRLQKELKQTELERVKLATALENYEKNSGFLQTEFKNIAQEIFDKKNESLIQIFKQQVNGLLAPLNEKIQNFRGIGIILTHKKYLNVLFHHLGRY